jgi:hypothetical protein
VSFDSIRTHLCVTLNACLSHSASHFVRALCHAAAAAARRAHTECSGLCNGSVVRGVQRVETQLCRHTHSPSPTLLATLTRPQAECSVVKQKSRFGATRQRSNPVKAPSQSAPLTRERVGSRGRKSLSSVPHCETHDWHAPIAQWQFWSHFFRAFSTSSTLLLSRKASRSLFWLFSFSCSTSS